MSELGHIHKLLEEHQELSILQEALFAAVDLLYTAIRKGGTILLCGNGGSAADAEHICGELMKGFLLPRRVTAKQEAELIAVCGEERGQFLAQRLQQSIPSISLVSGVSLPTAYANDVDPAHVFAQQVFGLGRAGDVLWAISTSGNSENVLRAMQVARARGIHTLGLTGQGGGAMAEWSDVLLAMPSTHTPKIQEWHLPVYHALCAQLEQQLF